MYQLFGWCPGYDTKLYLMLSLQSWKTADYGVILYNHYSQVLSELFKNYSYSIGPCAKNKNLLRNNYSPVD